MTPALLKEAKISVDLFILELSSGTNAKEVAFWGVSVNKILGKQLCERGAWAIVMMALVEALLDVEKPGWGLVVLVVLDPLHCIRHSGSVVGSGVNHIVHSWRSAKV